MALLSTPPAADRQPQSATSRQATPPGLADSALHAHAFATLRHLTDAHFVSGEVIARALGISRATVWQAVRQLQALGLDIHKVRRQGYRLARPYDALDAAVVSRALGAAGMSCKVHVVDACPSTNSDILRLADGTEPGGVIVLATELQTAGRGRRGRAWVSGLGTSLTFSVLRQFDSGLASLSGLSLAVGLAAARALAELGAQGVCLKWPNDVLVERTEGPAKLGGILIELAGDALGPTRAVIGIGLNLRLPPDARTHAQAAGALPVADLTDAGLTVARNRLLAALLRHLDAVLAVFSREGFAALRGEWNSHHAYQGRAVIMLNEGQVERTGTVEGVDASGALILASPGGIEKVVSGELSLRPRQGDEGISPA